MKNENKKAAKVNLTSVKKVKKSKAVIKAPKAETPIQLLELVINESSRCPRREGECYASQQTSNSVGSPITKTSVRGRAILKSFGLNDSGQNAGISFDLTQDELNKIEEILVKSFLKRVNPNS